MKIEFTESKWGTNFTLTPETPQEVAKVYRFTKSSKRKPPSIGLSFSYETPVCNVYFEKVQPNIQNEHLRNGKK